MHTARNHYEVMGLPRNATVAQIKRRYKQLVRKYHPDVATDKEMAHRLFIQITEAYQALSDPVRRKAYDETLKMEDTHFRHSHAPDAQHHTSSRPSHHASTHRSTSTTVGAPDVQFGNETVAQKVRDAQFAFIQKRFNEAASHCKEALEMDPRCARAHTVMGDIYRAQGRTQNAIGSYSYALQFDPKDKESERKLMELVGKEVIPKTDFVSYIRDPKRIAVFNTLGWAAVFILIMLIGVFPGQPISWLGSFAPPINRWSWNLVSLMAAASIGAGVLLSANGFLRHPDEEIIYENPGGSWVSVPTGWALLLGSGFFFIGAALFYATVSLLQGNLSKSVIIVFACVAVIVTLSAMMYPHAREQVLLFGGNVAFLSCLIGWYMGSMMRPLSEY